MIEQQELLTETDIALVVQDLLVDVFAAEQVINAAEYLLQSETFGQVSVNV
jgi:hypothetical protein